MQEPLDEQLSEGIPQEPLLELLRVPLQGAVGALTEKELTKQTGMEYVVKTGNGALITLVQSDDVPFKVSQRVIVVYGTRSRIIDDPDS